MKRFLTILIALLVTSSYAQVDVDSETANMECTTVTVGKKASADGSVMTSYTDDSGRSRTNMLVEKAADHPKDAMQELYKRVNCPADTPSMPRYCNQYTGSIPQ
ncbi:MAG: C69 family dipeptidase, partial [Bacteroidales bacterium]|nr:C69 family dipeptidase [Bacteroidales bacterium]